MTPHVVIVIPVGEEIEMQIAAILHLRQCHPVALSWNAGGISACRAVQYAPRDRGVKIIAGERAWAIDGEAPLQRQWVTVQPTARHDAEIELRIR